MAVELLLHDKYGRAQTVQEAQVKEQNPSNCAGAQSRLDLFSAGVSPVNSFLSVSDGVYWICFRSILFWVLDI
jgi:hypothetical protein